MRVVQPSPLMAGRVAEGTGELTSELSLGDRTEVSPELTGSSAQAVAVSPLSLALREEGS